MPWRPTVKARVAASIQRVIDARAETIRLGVTGPTLSYLQSDLQRWQGVLALLDQSNSEPEFNRACWQLIGGSSDMRVVTDIIADAVAAEPPTVEEPRRDRELELREQPQRGRRRFPRGPRRVGRQYVVCVYQRPAWIHGKRFAVGPFDSLAVAEAEATRRTTATTEASVSVLNTPR